MTRGLCIFCLLAALAGFGPEVLQAAPLVQIHDHVDIEMGTVRRVGGLVQIRGQLVERGSGNRVPNAKLWIQVDGNQHIVTTDWDGNYTASFPLRDGEHPLTIDFEGSQQLDAAHFERPNFDISKSSVSLAIHMASQIADSKAELRADIMATTDVGSAPLSLKVYFGPADEELKHIDTLQVDDEGRAMLVIDQQELGRPGRKRIEIRYAGSTEFDAAQVSKSLTVTSASSLSLEVNKERYDHGDTLVARGRLSDGRGNTIQGAAIAIEVAGQAVADAKTDERGDYRLRIDTDEFGSGSVILQARYDPTSLYQDASLSKPVRVIVGERKPIPIVYTVAAFALTSLALLSFVTLRTKPWEQWRSHRAADAASRKPGLGSDAPPPVTGLAPGRRKLVSTLSRATYSDFHGTVHNVITAQAIPHAAVVVATHREQELRCDEAGGFAISGMSDGEYKITVGAVGFVSEHFSVHMPHRGEFHDAQVDLLPVREKIFSLYKYAVRHLLPDSSLWGIWTPRQILDHMRESKPSERLSELTDFVEESFFSQRTPTEDKIELARAMIRGLDEEATGPGPQP